MTDLFVLGENTEPIAPGVSKPGNDSPPTAIAPRFKNSRRLGL
jgi:hypothetical protein